MKEEITPQQFLIDKGINPKKFVKCEVDNYSPEGYAYMIVDLLEDYYNAKINDIL